jgi:hypothetical protein
MLAGYLSILASMAVYTPEMGVGSALSELNERKSNCLTLNNNADRSSIKSRPPIARACGETRIGIVKRRGSKVARAIY